MKNRVVILVLAVVACFGLFIKAGNASNNELIGNLASQMSFKDVRSGSKQSFERYQNLLGELRFTNNMFNSVQSGPNYIQSGPNYISPGKYYKLAGANSQSAGDYRLPSVSKSLPVKFFIQIPNAPGHYKTAETSEEAVRRFIAENRPSHVWDDKWYNLTVPARKCVKLTAVVGDFDSSGNANWDRFSWSGATVCNGDTWDVITKEGMQSVPTEGQVKIRAFNNKVHFDFYNPPNRNGWTGDDIHYGFGY